MTGHRRAIYIFILLLALGAAAGCNKNVSVPEPAPQPDYSQLAADADQEAAVTVWHEYLKSAAGETLRPFRLEGSLRYTPPKGNGNRLSFYLWSNAEKPYRLDASAGFGSLVVGVRESDREFLAYVPEEKKAYAHKGWETPRFALPGLGEPLPVSIGDMAALLEGRYERLFDREYALVKAVNLDDYPELKKEMGRSGRTSSLYAYTLLRGALAGELLINSSGQPVFWKGVDGWSMVMGPEKGSHKLRKLTITHSQGHKAIILVKEREYPAPFTDAQLALLIPGGTDVLPVKRMK